MANEHHFTRRNFLRAGGILIVGVVGGGVFRGVQQGVFSVGQGEAYEPWANWQTDMGAGTLSLVRAAIIAANPHNSQPWLFRVSETQIDVYADTSRQIGTIDPLLREMYTGVGCALENLMLAAQVEGYNADIFYMPDETDTTYAARVTLSAGTPESSPLYDAIPLRRTNRLAYDINRPVPQEVIDRMDALNDDPDIGVVWVTDPAERARIGENIVAATEVLNSDEEQSSDSHQWWRGSWALLQERRDGITPDAGQQPFFAQFIKMLPDTDRVTADAAFLDQTRTRQVATAMGYGFLVARHTGDYAQRLRGGRLWQRIHLQGTIEGLGMQPLNQMAERADRETQLGLEPRFTQVLTDIINDQNFQVLMPFRFGYPIEQPGAPAPRRSVDTVLIA